MGRPRNTGRYSLDLLIDTQLIALTADDHQSFE
jgi:hypothetical protein